MTIEGTIYTIALGEVDKETKSKIAEDFAESLAIELDYSEGTVKQLRAIAQACRVVAGAIDEEAVKMAEALVIDGQ